MSHLNVEIKARCPDPERVRAALRERNADFRGTDRQTDTYFRCARGRLKLREGTIENALIHYHRENRTGPKTSRVLLVPVEPGSLMREALASALGVLATVQKDREIYFIDNVKFHVDRVEGLGSFVEIEAIDRDGSIGEPRLRRQCESFLEALGISDSDLLTHSYSDMLLEP